MRRDRSVLLLILVIGAFFRFSGLDWSVDPQSGRFHRFHPDEGTILDNAVWVGEDITQVKSAYGVVPTYILYAATNVTGRILDFTPFDNTDLRSERLSFLTGRWISACLGTATILLVFLIGHRAGDVRLGLVTASLLAFSPGHIQQCHYYTVDASLAFWVALALYLILKTPTNRWWMHVLIGLTVGIAGGYRFVAALLALPYVCAQIWHPEDRSLQQTRTQILQRLRRLVSFPSVACGLIALTVTALSTPALLVDADSFFTPGDQRNFIPSIDVATGKSLRLWNLYDFTTTPYVFYLTDLFPAALGFTCALSALIGIVLTITRPTRILTILLTWAVGYFLVTGGLFTKPIRYTTPLLPALCCLAAYAWLVSSRFLSARTGKSTPYTLALLIYLPTAAHGYAVSRVFTQENIRFEARRWIQNNIPRSASVIGETGGFPTRWMLNGFSNRKNDPGSLFMRTRNHVLPGNILDLLVETVSAVDYYVLIAQNRATPYTSASDTYPVGAQFYKRLRDGRIGYERIARYTRDARFWGHTFDLAGSDPTITAFDRPTIEVYRRTESHSALWSEWRKAVVANPSNPDSMILKGVTQFRRGDYAASYQTFDAAQVRFPELKLAELCRVEAIYQRETSEVAQSAFVDARVGQWDFAGLIMAGIPERGAEYIRLTQLNRPETRENLYLRQMGAKAFIKLGYDSYRKDEKDKAIIWYEKSLELSRHYLRPFRDLGILYLEKEQYESARDAFLGALGIRPQIDDLWIGLAFTQSRLGNNKAAYKAVQKMLSLDGPDRRHHTVLRDLAGYFRLAGLETWATEIETHLDDDLN